VREYCDDGICDIYRLERVGVRRVSVKDINHTFDSTCTHVHVWDSGRDVMVIHNISHGNID
jgi:hypothetical protein